MKRLFSVLFLVPALSVIAQKSGYEIKVTLKPFKNQYIYLGHHYGKQLPIIDSVMVNQQSEGVFKGNKKLGGGIYLIGYPNKSGYFEILVDKEQHFSVKADTANLKKGVAFQNSPDNVLFSNYQAFMIEKGNLLDNAYKQRSQATSKIDSSKWNDIIEKGDKEVRKYREDVMKKYPDATITFLFKAMREPEVPAAYKNPRNKQDSAYAFQYFKSHFWDGVNFYDDRLVRTPFFEPKLDKYFEQLVYPDPDSVNKEIDRMLGFASINEEMQKFLLIKFINRYLNQKYMWEDAVFVHLFEKYISQKKYSWLNDQALKTITDRAYSLMANILGTPAADIDLPDTSGKKVSLYAVQAPFVLVVIWDPTCSHCKELLPKLNSLYQSKWKANGMKMFALAKESDGTRNDWMKFINEHQIQEWTNVYYSRSDDKARTDAGIPGYSQLYDVLSFPTLYLLDKDKRIIAKKVAFDQVDDILQYKLKSK